MQSIYQQDFKEINLSLNDYILKIELNRPEASNAFTLSMIHDFCSVLSFADTDPNVRVILITGHGKHFCAGGDVKAMKNMSGMFAGEPNELREAYQKGIQQIPLTIERMSKPIVAMLNGAAVGAGCDLACMADIRVGCEDSKVGETFTKLALVPGDGGTFFLQRVVGYSKAMEMFLTAKIYNADEAREFGFFNYYVSKNELEKFSYELCQTISKNSPVAIEMTKKAMKLSYQHDLNSSLDLLSAYQGITQRSTDHFEAVDALLEKRDPKFNRK